MKSLLIPLLFLASHSLIAQSPAPKPKADKILFLGNSMTLHGPAPKIGWEGNWGMAATTQDKDYVHRVIAALTTLTGKAPEFKVANIVAFERGYETFDPDKELKAQAEFKPDLIILAIGENVAALTTDEKKASFKSHLLSLLTFLKNTGTPTIFVRSNFWANSAKDEILKADADAIGATYVDISNLDKDKKNYANSERTIAHEGVGRHPGDQGMQAIADALVQSIQAALK